MEKTKEFEEGMTPQIPPKPDFADMKNKIFFKQHSHYTNGSESKDRGNHRWRKRKEREQKQKLKAKRKDSPILKEMVNPKDVKRPKLILNQNDCDHAKTNQVTADQENTSAV